MNAFLPHRYYDSAVEGFNITNGHLSTFIFTRHGQQTTSQCLSPQPTGLGTHISISNTVSKQTAFPPLAPTLQTGPELHFLLLGSALVAPTVKNLPEIRRTQVQSLGQEYSPEKGMAIHSSVLAWRFLWAEATVHGATKSRTQLSN